MKKLLIVLLISSITTVSFAQQNRGQNNGSMGQRPEGDRGGDIMEKVETLNLTKAQKVQLKAIKDKNKTELAALKEDKEISKEDMREKMKAIRQETAKAVQAILTDDQKQELKDAMKRERGDGNGRSMRGGK